MTDLMPDLTPVVVFPDDIADISAAAKEVLKALS